jgi:hypothetical protein
LWIDSPHNRYQLRWGRWIRAGLVAASDGWRVQLWILGWRRSYSMLTLLRRRTKSPTQDRTRKKQPRKSGSTFSWVRLRKLLASFRVRHCRVDIDTDDVIWNAYLFPVSYFLQRAHYPVYVNYEGRIEVELLVENRPIWIIRALLF